MSKHTPLTVELKSNLIVEHIFPQYGSLWRVVSWYKIVASVWRVSTVLVHKAIPGADGPGPSLEGPGGELRLSRMLLAELLRRRFTAAIGGGPPLPP